MSLPVCLSIADVPLRQTKSLQHRSCWRNALWDELTSSFLSSSTSLISLTLIIAPSAWQRPYHKCGQVYSEPSLRNIKSPWQPLLISFASSACIIYRCQIWSPRYCPRLSLQPLFSNFLFLSIFTTAYALFVNVYAHTQTYALACALWVCEKRKWPWH